MNNSSLTISDFVDNSNASKVLFTAGPASLLKENITGLRPCFGRGDKDYTAVENRVLAKLCYMSGHDKIIRMQGAASLALEVMINNFLFGNILIVDTGYYSDRLSLLANQAMKNQGEIASIKIINWKELHLVDGRYDWLLACYTETSCGLKLPIDQLRRASERIGAKLMLDATASIGLEDNHGLADVIGFSSCKGLFGLTGAAFIAYNENPTVPVNSFYLSFQTHQEKKMTGPYHSIASLDDVLSNHNNFRQSVVENKKVFTDRFKDELCFPESHQPLLCTYVDTLVSAKCPNVVMYSPRSNLQGSVVCHLGEAHLGISSEGKILDLLESGT